MTDRERQRERQTERVLEKTTLLYWEIVLWLWHWTVCVRDTNYRDIQRTCLRHIHRGTETTYNTHTKSTKHTCIQRVSNIHLRGLPHRVYITISIHMLEVNTTQQYSPSVIIINIVVIFVVVVVAVVVVAVLLLSLLCLLLLWEGGRHLVRQV